MPSSLKADSTFRDRVKEARRMRAHAALTKSAFPDVRQAAWRTACRVSDEVTCKEAHADNRELASNVNQLDFSDEDDWFPKVGSIVRLAGLRHNDRVFNGVRSVSLRLTDEF